jgi:hypothetical protein
MRSHVKLSKWLVCCALAAGLLVPARLSAQATLLLEEPYSYDGAFAGTGHTAVYLSRVCAETPTELRRCLPGETGVVISRYHHVGGFDWIAVPLLPYLYAVEKPESIPLYADTKLVDFLRREYLQDYMPELMSDFGPRSPLNQLAGSAYDRTLYGFRIATRPEQDDELIRILNSSSNQEAYKLLNRNCADFVKQIINFYYPKAIHRSVIADLGVMTPKQAAKTLVHSAKHHRQMQLTRFIIPQVPGLKRSKPVHGVIESVVLAKKYVTPVLLFHPFVVGTVEAAYWAGWRFNPAKGALIFDAPAGEHAGRLQMPLSAGERRAYEKSVAGLKQENGETDQGWEALLASAEPELDASGQPFLRVPTEEGTVQIGLCRGNALRLSTPPELIQELMLTRIEHELKPGKPSRASMQQIRSDWKLLQDATEARQAALNSAR